MKGCQSLDRVRGYKPDVRGMMLPSEFAEVQVLDSLKLLLAEHVDMQFGDIRAMLRLPIGDITAGCNFATTAFLLSIIAGASVCFYRASEAGLKARGERGDRFKAVLREFYPWHGEPVTPDEGAALLYEAARNPLAHSLGLDELPAAGKPSRAIVLKKSRLTAAEIAELEDSAGRPTWVGTTVRKAVAASGAEEYSISVAALYWGVHRMLHGLFGHPQHGRDANVLAKQFGPLWGKYVTPESGMLTLTGYAPIVKPEDVPGTK